MSEKPILFKPEMVRAILDGRKTQTRRVVNWPDWLEDHDAGAFWLNRHPCAGLHKDGRPIKRFCCPYGSPGDVLWVRETHALLPGIAGADRPIYRADGDKPWHRTNGVRWRPSIHMPRWAARLLLRVTDVRVERLQEITPNDAAAEGVGAQWDEMHDGNGPRDRFRDLWDTINAKRGHGWDTNPWVWATSFERSPMAICEECWAEARRRHLEGGIGESVTQVYHELVKRSWCKTREPERIDLMAVLSHSLKHRKNDNAR